jgi:hypothetical protein
MGCVVNGDEKDRIRNGNGRTENDDRTRNGRLSL